MRQGLPRDGRRSAGRVLDGIAAIGEGNIVSEYPRHKVKIDKPFAVGKFEVTWDDWEACVDMRGCDGRPTGDSASERGAAR